MGVFERSLDKARALQKQCILDEAGRAGSVVGEVQEHDDGRPGGSTVLRNLPAALGEGGQRVDALQIFRLVTGSTQHLYLQPYAGTNPLPGEHHARLEGTLASAAILRKRIFGVGKWDAGDDRVTARMLAGAAPLGKVIGKLSWNWKTDTVKIGLSWLVQLRPLAGGGTHLVMRAGRYGGPDTCRVGLPQFVLLSRRLAHLLVPGGAAADAAFLEPPAFGELFASLVLGREIGAPDAVSAAPVTPPADGEAVSSTPAGDASRADLVRAVIAPRQGRRVHAAPVPEKKARAVREDVLPPQAGGEELVALVDLTMMTGTARDAVVFTPGHCHAKEVDVTASFRLDRLVQVHGYANRLRDRIDVEIAGRGRVRVPVGSHGPLLLELFRKLAAHNHPSAPDG